MLIIRMTLGPKLNNIGFYNLFHKANFISLDIRFVFLFNVDRMLLSSLYRNI